MAPGARLRPPRSRGFSIFNHQVGHHLGAADCVHAVRRARRRRRAGSGCFRPSHPQAAQTHATTASCPPPPPPPPPRPAPAPPPPPPPDVLARQRRAPWPEAAVATGALSLAQLAALPSPRLFKVRPLAYPDHAPPLIPTMRRARHPPAQAPATDLCTRLNSCSATYLLPHARRYSCPPLSPHPQLLSLAPRALSPDARHVGRSPDGGRHRARAAARRACARRAARPARRVRLALLPLASAPASVGTADTSPPPPPSWPPRAPSARLLASRSA